MVQTDSPLHKFIWYVATLAIGANAFFIKRLVESQDTIAAQVETVHVRQSILEVKISALTDNIDREFRHNRRRENRHEYGQ